MGLLLDSDSDNVQSKIDHAREAVVDHQKTQKQVVSRMSEKLGGKPNWTDIFARLPDLAPPGYEQAVRETVAATKAKKQAKLDIQQAKKKS